MNEAKEIPTGRPWHTLPAAERWSKVAERIVDKQTRASVERLSAELHQSYNRGRKEARREVRQDMYALGAVDNAARRLLLAIDHEVDQSEAIEQLRRVLTKSPGSTPYPLSVVKLRESADLDSESK